MGGASYILPNDGEKAKGISLYVTECYIICGHIFQWLLSKKRKAPQKSYKR